MMIRIKQTDKNYSVNINNPYKCFFKIYFFVFVNILFNLAGMGMAVLFLLLSLLRKNPYLLIFIPFISFIIATEEFLHILMFKIIYKVSSFIIKFVIVKYLVLKRVETIPDLPKENIWDFKVFIFPPLFMLLTFIFSIFIFYFLNLDKKFLIYPISGVLYSLSSLIPLGPPIKNDAYNAYRSFVFKKEGKR